MRKFLVTCALLTGLFLVPAQPTLAACHRFTANASPNPVAEGAMVAVTVSRDAAVGPSSVEVSTVDETAKAGPDYTALRQTVNFTSETSQVFQVKTTDDSGVESPETFRLHLSNPSGCAVNPNYVVGPDVTVTINDNDRASTTPTSGTGTTATTVPSTSRTTAATSPTGATVAPLTGPTEAPPTEATSSTSTSLLGDQATGTTEDNGGGSGGVIAAIVAAIIIVAGGGGYLLYRLRRPAA